MNINLGFSGYFQSKVIHKWVKSEKKITEITVIVVPVVPRNFIACFIVLPRFPQVVLHYKCLFFFLPDLCSSPQSALQQSGFVVKL